MHFEEKLPDDVVVVLPANDLHEGWVLLVGDVEPVLNLHDPRASLPEVVRLVHTLNPGIVDWHFELVRFLGELGKEVANLKHLLVEGLLRDHILARLAGEPVDDLYEHLGDDVAVHVWEVDRLQRVLHSDLKLVSYVVCLCDERDKSRYTQPHDLTLAGLVLFLTLLIDNGLFMFLLFTFHLRFHALLGGLELLHTLCGGCLFSTCHGLHLLHFLLHLEALGVSLLPLRFHLLFTLTDLPLELSLGACLCLTLCFHLRLELVLEHFILDRVEIVLVDQLLDLLR
mmetsp:Transcript_46307/g.74475  ORF Transcript_46307/g.74475 Transcript_46307/m.74475 type:complete len:284 (-) Transcript_46307:55-906(-)